MAEPFENLPQIMTEYADGIESAVGALVRRIALKVAETAAETTRADTGLARSNWVAQIGTPFTGIVTPYAPGSRLGISEGANLSGALNQHQSAIAPFNPKRDRAIYITNNVPYIGYLNNGSPTTSADMMAQRAVQAGRALVLNTRVLVRKKV